jgi:hypothetical protein
MADKTQEPEITPDQIRIAMRRHSKNGRPEVVAQLKQHLANETLPPRHLVVEGAYKANRFIEEDLEVPDRAGPKSKKALWIDFAMKTTDMEREVLDKMGRDDIISMLEVKGIIDKEED